MVTTRKPLTPAEQRAQRIAELDWQQQMQANFEAERAARQVERDAFLQKVEKYHEQRQAALERGEELEAPVIPTLNGVFQAKAEQERLEAEEAERQRILQLDPRAVLISALTPEKREFIGRWQAANPGVTFPLEALAMH